MVLMQERVAENLATLEQKLTALRLRVSNGYPIVLCQAVHGTAAENGRPNGRSCHAMTWAETDGLSNQLSFKNLPKWMLHIETNLQDVPSVFWLATPALWLDRRVARCAVHFVDGACFAACIDHDTAHIFKALEKNFLLLIYHR
jgi:hypothetical protein